MSQERLIDDENFRRYVIGFMEDVSERNEWSAEQWREATSNWDDEDRNLFLTIYEYKPDEMEVLGAEAIFYMWEAATADESKIEDKELLESFKYESAFCATMSNISQEARDRILEVLTS